MNPDWLIYIVGLVAALAAMFGWIDGHRKGKW